MRLNCIYMDKDLTNTGSFLSICFNDRLKGGQSRDPNKLLCVNILTEPVSRSAVSFLTLNENSRG